jgi:hypothetical protein
VTPRAVQGSSSWHRWAAKLHRDSFRSKMCGSCGHFHIWEKRESVIRSQDSRSSPGIRRDLAAWPLYSGRFLPRVFWSFSTRVIKSIVGPWRRANRIRAQKVTSRSRFVRANLTQQESRGFSQGRSEFQASTISLCDVLCYHLIDERGTYLKRFLLLPLARLVVQLP